MIQRLLIPRVQELAAQYPVVTIVGPRQSGKSTLTQMAFPNLPVVNLELPDQRARITADPKKFIEDHRGGCILDEIQYLPDIASYIQVAVDERKTKGEFILTGSQQFQLMEAVSQSLAGRTAIARLLPLSRLELEDSGYILPTIDEQVFTGGYPRIYDDKLSPTQSHSFYVQTYLERDVRKLLNVRDILIFERFLKLVATRSGQLFNATSLGNDAGIDQSTVKQWLSVLEASFILFRVAPHFNNLSKRVVKSPKIYFCDSGLLCFLLGIRDQNELAHHPLRGVIIESYVAAELLKNSYNAVKEQNIYFFRDSTGNEIDFLREKGQQVVPIEVKASSTFSESFLRNIETYQSLPKAKVLEPKVIYTGNERFTVRGIEVVPLNCITEL